MFLEPESGTGDVPSSSSPSSSVPLSLSLSQSKGSSDAFGIQPAMVDHLYPQSVGIMPGPGDSCLPAYPGARSDGRPFASHSGLIVGRPPQFPPPGHGCVVDCLVGVPPEPGLVAELDKAASTQPEETRETRAR